MHAIKMISAQVGRVKGRGLAGNMRRHCPAVPIILLLIANVINIGADLGATAAAEMQLGNWVAPLELMFSRGVHG